MSEAPVAPAPLKRRAFHPPLLALAPVLLVYAPNSGLLPVGSLVRPLLVAVAVSLALWGVAAAVSRAWLRGATFASVVLGLMFAYAILGSRWPIEEDSTRAIVYTAVVALLAGIAAWKLRDPRPLNAFAILLFALSVVQAGMAYRSHQGSESGRAASGGQTGAERPDVYYIVLDGYGREDAMREKVGYDGAFFTKGLRDLGFFVADRSRANYVQTELSLASSLNMEHLAPLFAGRPPNGEDRSPFDRLIAENAVTKTLEAHGYRFVAVTTGFPAIAFPRRDSGYTPVGGLTLLETALLDLTPLRAREEFVGSQFIARRGWLRGAFDALGALAGDSGQPKFVFAHILAPHPPFVFDAEGRDAKYETGFGYYDGSDWIERNGDRARYAEGYRGQATWTARQTLATVRRLIAASRRPPIIIVQGDHGPKSGLTQNSLSETDLQECVPNLNAYFVPAAIRAKLDTGVTPVNSFRIVLGALFGLDLPRRPDTSYFSPFAKPMELTDVTDRIR